MKKLKENSSFKTLTYRQKEEDFQKTSTSEAVSVLSDGETLKLIHELEVHQIELEMQNEELLLAKEKSELSVRKYTELYDFSPSGHFKLSKNGIILELNLSGAKILGKERSQLKNSRFAFFVSQYSLPAFNKFLEAVFKLGIKATEEVSLSIDGNMPIYVQLTGIRTNIEDQCLITVSDITERKMISDTQKFLLQCGYPGSGKDFFGSLAKFLAQSLDMDYVCIDKIEGEGLTAQTVAIYNNGKFDANQSYTLRETPCGDVVGKTICCFPKNVRRLFPNDVALQELKAESYVGTTLWSFDGKPIGLIAVIGKKPLNNTSVAEAILKLVAIRAAGELERNQSEAALRESEEKFRLLFDTMIDGFAFHEIIVDEKGKPCDYRFLSVNRAYERLTALKAENIIGKKVSEVLPSGEDQWIDRYGKVALNGDNINFEHYSKKLNRFFKIITYSHKKGYFATIHDDITDRVKAEQKVKERTAELENVNIRLNQELMEHDLAEAALKQNEVKLKELIATKDKFFNIVAHDLKNPFTSLLGSSELLYDNLDKMTPKNIKKLALILNDSAKGGYSILLNLLDWSRSQTGQLKISPEKINLKDIIRENISNLQLPSTNKEIWLTYESAEDIHITIDKNMLNTVIRNLLSNALKFSYRHGTVIINAKIEKDGVVISIKDSGIGILQENIAKLFSIESRNSMPGTENEQGTGLGLKLCKEFIEKLNGKIWVESAIDKGSVFSFSVPKNPRKSV
ncbi:MAG TPA: ATP-binding protein [Bacteroidales bacterium]